MSIVGQWYETTDTSRLYANNVLQSTIPRSYNRTDYILFNGDGTGSSSLSGTIVPFTYTLSNTALTVNEAAYTINNISYPAVTAIGTVKLLTTTNFVVEFDFTSVMSGVTCVNKQVDYYTK